MGQQLKAAAGTVVAQFGDMDFRDASCGMKNRVRKPPGKQKHKHSPSRF